MAKLIDADVLPYDNQVLSYDDEWCLKVSDIEAAPTVEAVPVSELLELRDWLYEHDSIFMDGLWRLNDLISKYKKDGG